METQRQLWGGLCAGLGALVLAGQAVAQTGALLTVTTTPPAARLSVDGTVLGATPLADLPLVIGHHRVELSLDGYSTDIQELDVVGGQQVKIDVALVSMVPPAIVAPVPTAETGVSPAAAPLAATAPSPEPPKTSHPWLGVPWPTWIAGGVAAGLFGVGLGFGIAAGNIDHLAGVDVSATGVDQGLTRATALAGQQDATIGNVLMISAGVVTLVGLGFAALAPDPPVDDPHPAAGGK